MVDRTDDSGLKLYFDERSKLNELLFHEEIYWKQRAKALWLVEGDKNTKFFYANASTKKKTNHIDFLLSDNGERIEDRNVMCDAVKNYFEVIFCGESGSTAPCVFKVELCVTAKQNDSLLTDISFEEF